MKDEPPIAKTVTTAAAIALRTFTPGDLRFHPRGNRGDSSFTRLGVSAIHVDATLTMILEVSRIMVMPFSVKSEKADELLAEVRAITGEGITDAVVNALQTRLEECKRVDQDTLSMLHKLWNDNPQLLWQEGQPEHSVTFNEWMYDSNGLPK